VSRSRKDAADIDAARAQCDVQRQSKSRAT